MSRRRRLRLRIGARVFVALIVPAAAACSLLTDYSVSNNGTGPPGSEASTSNDGTSGDGSVDPNDATNNPDTSGPQCTETPCIVDIASAGQTTCARSNDGIVRCWGYGRTGVTGAATQGNFPVPMKIAFDGPVDEISVGDWGQEDTAACARRGASIECWGQDGTERRLGRGGDASAGNFVPVPGPVVGVANAVAVSVGSQRVCARVGATGDALSCWGMMYSKKIESSAVPIATPKPVKQVVGGRTHDCVLLDSDEVACAGYTYYFRENWPDSGSGPGQNDFQIIPNLSGVAQLATTGNFVCALKKGGVVVCWGRNKRGQLGRGTMEKESPLPTPVTLPSSAKSIGTGHNHACAVLIDDTVWCWGRNGGGPPKYDGTTTIRGQVGTAPDGGLDELTTTARKIDGLPAGGVVRAVVGGYEHSCALLASGAVYCWGSNSHGQLGRGFADSDSGIDEMAHPKANRVLFGP